MQGQKCHLARQGAGHSSGRLDHLALPDCQPIYTQGDNLQHGLPSGRETATRKEDTRCDAPIVKTKKKKKSDLLASFSAAFPEDWGIGAETFDNVLFCHCVLGVMYKGHAQAL